MKKVVALILSSLFTLGICEVALRLLWHNPYRYEAPDEELKINTHHPNSDYLILVDEKDPSKRAKLRTDARSYLLPSFQHKDPDVTIGFLGGSTTESRTVPEDHRFPALISDLFTERGVKANTLNAGRSGNTLHDALNILLNHMVEDRPDIVVLMHAANDVGVLQAEAGYKSKLGHPVTFGDMGKWTLQMASSNVFLAGLVRSWEPASLLRLVTPDAARPQAPSTQTATQTQTQSSGAMGQGLVDKSLVEMYRQRLRAFVHIARSFDIQPIMMTEPFTGSTNALTPDWVHARPLDQFNAVVREVGEQEGAPVIDLVHFLQTEVPEWAQPDEIFFDGIHVTEKGSRVYAKYITERLAPFVQDRTHNAASQKHKSSSD